jgi:alpha-glucosidase
VPVVWDETRFLAGEPGQFVVLARRNGNQWYIGGINGENAGRDVDVALSFLGQSRCTVTLIEDGKTPRSFDSETKAVTSQDHLEVRQQPYGGFVAVLSPTR